LFSFSLLVLSSCSNDDNLSDAEPEPVTSTLVKKIISSNTDGSLSTENATYNGNKLTSVFRIYGIYEDITNVSYSGDLITKIENSNGNHGVYTYENNKVKTYVETYSNISGGIVRTTINIFVYVYNTDGTVSFMQSFIDPDTKKEIPLGNGIMIFLNGNLIRKEIIFDYGWGEKNKQITTYEYDTKHNPFKNNVGYDLLLNDVKKSSVNNVLKSTETSSYPNISSSTETYTYIYDVNGFPIERKKYDSQGKFRLTQFFY
jgi:hypothetical protein